MDSNLHKKEHIYALINHIEHNLSFQIDTKYLSELGYVSHMQLYRDFYSITGHSVKEYIRKRRLSNALALIKHSEMSLADISYECGYTSQQILCTNVKNALGLTPLEYRRSEEYYYFPPFNSIRERQISIATVKIPETLCVKYYNSQVLGIEKAAVQYFLSLVPDFKGRIFGRDGIQNGSKLCYELYLTDAEGITDKLKNSEFVIDGISKAIQNNFALTTVKNREAEINSAWDYLYTDWLGLSMFEYTGESYFEEYILKNSNPKKLRLYLPIRKKSDYTKITFEKPGSMKFLVSMSQGSQAERITSEHVINYLKEHHPYILRNSKQFYINKTGRAYISGMRIMDDLKLNKDTPLYILNTSDCLYAVLHSSASSDYSLYQDILLRWVSDNGFTLDHVLSHNTNLSQDISVSHAYSLPINIKSIFAVYDVSSGFDNPQVKLYCPVKMV